MQQRRALGRGLESLIPTAKSTEVKPKAPTVSTSTGATAVPLDSISPNRQQPRQVFDEERIRELADSIREQGLIQPLVVTELKGGRYELVAGERRLRAARMLGLSEIPVVIKDVDEAGLLTLALIENVQREDLGPIEEAQALKGLIDQFDCSQEEVAKKVGKSRSHVANSLRLLKLPQVIQDDLAAGRYSAGHARALLSLSNVHERLKFREILIDQIPSVRDVEMMVQKRVGGGTVKKRREQQALSPQLSSLMGEIVQALGTKVRLRHRKNGAGQLVIDFYSPRDLDRIYRKIVM
jgi:ParB family chromosome partitioning protein